MDAELAKIIVAAVTTVGSILVAAIALFGARKTSRRTESSSPDFNQHEQTRMLIREQTLEMRDHFIRIHRVIASGGELPASIAVALSRLSNDTKDGD